MGKKIGPAARTVAERIRASSRVESNGCWTWLLFTQYGYGRITVGSRTDGSTTVVRAHRASYEAFVGPIPDGYHVDHLCRNRACVNPDHLEAVTPRVNAIRRVRGQCADEGHVNGGTPIMIKGKRHCRRCRPDLVTL